MCAGNENVEAVKKKGTSEGSCRSGEALASCGDPEGSLLRGVTRRGRVQSAGCARGWGAPLG